VIEQLWNDNLVWRIFALPMDWRLWVIWLMVVNSACFLFLSQKAARIVAVVWIGNVVTMMTMYWLFGYVRLLGLSHVLWWTPLFLWLVPWLRRERPAGAFAMWLYLLVASDLASLAIDYVDVVRYILGDRTPA
jgi:hypothetical protein